LKLFHVSEEPGIALFTPRPSPQIYSNIKGAAVFAISDEMLHNYLLPRDCPRVCYYAKTDSLQADIGRYIGDTDKKFIITVEESWLERINNTKLYLYEMPSERFEQIDEGAGYYVSYETVKPLSVLPIDNLFDEIVERDVELRVLSSLKQLAYEISNSSLHFSIIRLRNAD